jgi:hypothetical protein
MGTSKSKTTAQPLPAAPLVVRRRYLIMLPNLLPAAPLVECRRYLAVVPRPLPRCASQVLDQNAQAAARGVAALSRQEKKNSADVQLSRASVFGFIYTVAR